jgi:hypothetical protein
MKVSVCVCVCVCVAASLSEHDELMAEDVSEGGRRKQYGEVVQLTARFLLLPLWGGRGLRLRNLAVRYIIIPCKGLQEIALKSRYISYQSVRHLLSSCVLSKNLSTRNCSFTRIRNSSVVVTSYAAGRHGSGPHPGSR